ncbi:putative GED domain-containing protein [Seiridium cardinale]
MSTVSLDQHALGQLDGEQKALLDTIDDLRKHGVGRFVDLPQIIVVGDQSSGKSSVLEAISRVRFPVKDGLCTRFATELVLRTDSRTKVDVQIQPLSSTNKDLPSFNETRFNKDELPRIIENAKRTMLQDGDGFSEDVLRVEVCGPDVPHLTLVDLPGFYHSENEKQSAADHEIVERLAERYMAKKNSIILAIISARNQIILQKVLSKVKLHDKDRVRTLGIITKPDMLKTGSQDEEEFVRLAKNLDKSQALSLGWHVLRNRGEDEESDSDKERDQKESDFFQTGAWSSVPSKDRGIDVLRRKLSNILLVHIKHHVQGLIEVINAKMTERKTLLKSLGEPRSSPRELRAYLDKVATQFQILSLNAIDGNYIHEFFGGLFPDTKGMSVMDGRVRKLRAIIRDLNRVFTYVLLTKGSTSVILAKDASGEDDKDERQGSQQQPLLPHYLKQLVSFYSFDDPKRITFEEATAKLEAQFSANQGNEFPGTSNGRLAIEFFRHQSQPWEAIARKHVQIVLATTKTFVEKLFDHITSPDNKTYSTILAEVVDPFFDKKSVLLEGKIQELLHHYRHGNPQPLDSEFRSRLASRNRKTVEKEVVLELLKSQPELFTQEARGKLMATTKSTYQSEFDAEGLINKAESYYEISLRTFTENMVILAIENCLIEDLPHLFTSEKVNQMENEELEQLAAETEELRLERAQVKEEHDSLKKGLEFCSKYRKREASLFAELDKAAKSMDAFLTAERAGSNPKNGSGFSGGSGYSDGNSRPAPRPFGNYNSISPGSGGGLSSFPPSTTPPTVTSASGTELFRGSFGDKSDKSAVKKFTSTTPSNLTGASGSGLFGKNLFSTKTDNPPVNNVTSNDKSAPMNTFDGLPTQKALTGRSEQSQSGTGSDGRLTRSASASKSVPPRFTEDDGTFKAIQNICASAAHMKYSPEELRLRYQHGNTGTGIAEIT